MLIVYIYRRNFLLKTTPFMKFIHTVHTQLVQSLYLRNFPWNEIKIYCIIVIKMFLALSPIILCSIHPWFWNALYNVYIISYQWRREERDDERQLEESYFVYSAIFYESLKVTVNASCKFKDCKIERFPWRWSNWINEKNLVIRQVQSHGWILRDLATRFPFYQTNSSFLNGFLSSLVRWKG